VVKGIRNRDTIKKKKGLLMPKSKEKISFPMPLQYGAESDIT